MQMFYSVFHRTAPYLVGLGVLLLVAGTMPAPVEGAEVGWEKLLEDGMKEAEETGKPVMLDFYTDW